MTARRAQRALKLVGVFLISLIPLVVGFAAGVTYAVARIVWSALAEGFAAGKRLIS